MILTPKALNEYLYQVHKTITIEKREEILAYFAEDPDKGQPWTENDIWEQVRKMIR